jgi:hypothetical protein
MTRTGVGPMVAVLLAVWFAGPAPVSAQAGAPAGGAWGGRLGLTLRGGLQQPQADDALFGVIRDQLAVAPADLRVRRLGVEVSWALTPRWELALGTELGRQTARSEARVSPAEAGVVAQRTTLESSPVAVATARYYPWPAAAAVGGWTPRVYAGLGAGLLRVGLTQEGRFPDAGGGAAFTDRFASRSVGQVVALSVGAVLQRVRGPGLVLEAGYQVAGAPVGADFAAFDRIDLSGAQLSVGLRQRW